MLVWSGILFSLTMLMVSVALVMAVIVTNIFLRKDSGKRVPSSVRRVFLHRRHRSRHTHTHTHTHTHGHTDTDRQRERGTERHRARLPSHRESLTSSAAPAIISPSMVVGVARNHDSSSAAVKYRETDLDSLSILSELDQQQQQHGGGGAGLVRQNSRRGYSLSTRRCSPSTAVTANSRRPRQPPQHVDTDSGELYSREWQMLAKVVDRIFFWLFVVSSIGALGSMFVSLPHKNLS